MRTTTDAPTSTTCTSPARSTRPGLRTTALSVGVGAAAIAALMAPAVGTPAEAATTAASAPTTTISPAALSVADRQAAADRSAGRSSRSAQRGAVPSESADAIPASLEAPELEKAGTRYTTVDLNIRVAPDEDADVVKVLDAGAKIAITDVTSDEWRQVIYKDEPGWVKGKYLSKTKPEAAGVSSAPCPSGSGVEGGLKASTISVHRAVCHAFPSVTTYGGTRGGGGNHGSGRALDIMVSGSTGDQIAAYVRAHAGELGVTEVIWEQRIWTTQRASEGWRGMPDRGSATANHYDHVHVSTR